MRKKKEEEKQKLYERIREQNRLKQQYSLEQTNNPDNYVFKIDGEDIQEKSFIHPDILKEIKEEEEKEMKGGNAADSTKKKKKKKKKA